jgi:heme exporter protein B
LLRPVFNNIRKDFRIEFRSRYALSIALSFAGITTLAVSLTAGGLTLSAGVLAILYWVILFFSAMSGLSHIFIREEEEGTALFLRITSPPAVVYAAKLAFNAMLMLIISSVTTPLFVFFLNAQVALPLLFTATVLLGGLAIAAATTLLAAMVAKAGGKGALFSVLSFPVLLPALWVSIKTTAACLTGSSAQVPGSLVFLAAYSGAVTAVSFLLFEHIWVEE